MNITMSDEAFVYIVVLPLCILSSVFAYFITLYLLKRYTDIGIDKNKK